MNDVLQLKGTFEQKSNSSRPGAPELPAQATVKIEHVRQLKRDLEQLKEYWQKSKLINGALISVFYIDVIAKSRRISATLAKGNETSNSSIVGAKFSNDNKLKHVITHYVSIDTLDESINRYNYAICILEKSYNGLITADDIQRLNNNLQEFNYPYLSKTIFAKIIVDSYYVEKFRIPSIDKKFSEDSIITQM